MESIVFKPMISVVPVITDTAHIFVSGTLPPEFGLPESPSPVNVHDSGTKRRLTHCVTSPVGAMWSGIGECLPSYNIEC